MQIRYSSALVAVCVALLALDLVPSDVSAATVLKTIALPDATLPAAKMAMLSDGSRLYATTGLGVSIIATDTDTVTKTLPLDGTTAGALASPDGSKVYVLRLSHPIVHVIDTSTDTFCDSFDVPGSPGDMVIAPDGASAYTVHPEEKSLSAIDLQSKTVTQTVALPDKPETIAVNPTGTRLYVGCEGACLPDPDYGEVQTLLIFALPNLALTGRVPSLSTGITGFAFTQDGSKLHVVAQLSGWYGFFDTGTCAFDPGRTTTIGVEAPDAAADPLGRHIYVGCWDPALKGCVFLLDPWSSETQEKLVVDSGEGFPLSLAALPSGEKLYACVWDRSTGTAKIVVITGLEQQARGPEAGDMVAAARPTPDSADEQQTGSSQPGGSAGKIADGAIGLGWLGLLIAEFLRMLAAKGGGA